MLIMRDTRSRDVFADVAPHAGANTYAIRRISQRLDMFGYTRIALESDGEQSIRSLKHAVSDCKHKLEMGESSVGEYEMDGAIEVVVRFAQGRFDLSKMTWKHSHAWLLIDIAVWHHG